MGVLDWGRKVWNHIRGSSSTTKALPITNGGNETKNSGIPDVGNTISQRDENEIFNASPTKIFRQSQIPNPGGGNEENGDKPGDDYVTSDIHEHYQIYQEMLKQLSPNDRLWILGDILFCRDGETGTGINILLDIAQRTEKEEGPRVEVILGNHDIDLIRWIEEVKSKNITTEEMRRYIQIKLNQIDNPQYILSSQESEIIGKVEESVNSISGICSADNCVFFYLPDEEQEKIYKLLKNAPYFVSTQIGDTKVALVHSLPPDIEPKLDVRMTEDYINGLDMPDEEKKGLKKHMIWGSIRESNNQKIAKKWMEKGWTIIRGHEPQKEMSKRRDFINVNLGKRDATMALYCIQTGKVKFFKSLLLERNPTEVIKVGCIVADDLSELEKKASDRWTEYYQGVR